MRSAVCDALCRLRCVWHRRDSVRGDTPWTASVPTCDLRKARHGCSSLELIACPRPGCHAARRIVHVRVAFDLAARSVMRSHAFAGRGRPRRMSACASGPVRSATRAARCTSPSAQHRVSGSAISDVDPTCVRVLPTCVQEMCFRRMYPELVSARCISIDTPRSMRPIAWFSMASATAIMPHRQQ
jgi:hypothetical protein